MERRSPPPPPPVTVLRGHSSGVQGLCFLTEDILLSGISNGMTQEIYIDVERCQAGVVKAWNLERRRVCAEFQASPTGLGVQRIDRLGHNKVVSQTRDGRIRVWDAESLVGGGSRAQETGSGTACFACPEPLRELATGAFHFCQFALTRWREPPARNGESTKVGRGHGHDSGTREGTHGGRSRGGINKISDGSERDSADDDDSSAGGGVPGAGRGQGLEGLSDGAGSSEGAQAGGQERATSDGSFAENAVLTPCEDQHAVRLWDLRDSAPAYTIVPADAERRGMVMCARLLGESPSCANPFAVCGHDSGYLCVYDVRATSAEPLMESRLHNEPLLCVDVGSSCIQGVSGSADDSVHVFRINTKKVRAFWRRSCEVTNTFRSQRPGTACVEIRHDQKLFVIGGWDHRLRAFSWKSPRPLAVLRSHEGSVYSIAHSPRIGGLASGSADSRVAVWDLFPAGER